MRAIITAGGRIDGDFAARAGTPVKALIEFGGRTLLERACAAARGIGAKSVTVVGGAEIAARKYAFIDKLLPAAPTGEENLTAALLAYPDDNLLFLTSDLPYITSDSVQHFLDRVPSGALGMPLAAADQYEHRFPNSPEHATVIGGERVANGSVFYIPEGAAPRIVSTARKFFSARKSMVRMALLLGPGLLVKFATRRLRIADLETRAGKELGVAAHAIRDCAPELCFDIDTLADYEYVLNDARHR